MSEAEALFHQIAAETPDATESKMFGSLCIKAPNGKAAVFFKNNRIAFKLESTLLQETLSLDGAKTFYPVEAKKMNGWVELPFDYAEQWPELTKNAISFVKNLPK